MLGTKVTRLEPLLGQLSLPLYMTGKRVEKRSYVPVGDPGARLGRREAHP